MTAEPPPLPTPEPPPLPRRKRHWPYGLLLLPLAGVAALWFGPLRVEVDFIDDAGRAPRGSLEVTLRSGGSEKKVHAEDGRLHLLRGVWQELEVTDLSYVRSTHPVRGGRMLVAVERNTLLKLKHAATGQASVPQRGDPDPRADPER